MLTPLARLSTRRSRRKPRPDPRGRSGSKTWGWSRRKRWPWDSRSRALSETMTSDIRDKRLYRETHQTFEAFCAERWGFTKTHANRQIAGASVMEDLTPIGVKLKNLEQTKPLARLTSDQRKE